MKSNELSEKEKEIRNPKQFVLGEILRLNAVKFQDKTAVAFEDKRYSYKEFNLRVNRLANALIDLGVKKGDKIAALGYNCVEYLEAAFGAAKVGAPFVPINFRLVGPEIEFIINHNDVVALFIDYPLLDQIKDIKANFKLVKSIIVMRGEAPEGMLKYDDLLSSGSDNEPQVYVWDEDIVLLGQTGGTTGRPKGVIHSHRSLASICIGQAFIHGFRETDRSLCIFPSYSSAFFAWECIPTLFTGCSLHMLPIPPFDPLEVIKTIDREKINHAALAAVMLDAISLIPEGVRSQYDVSSVRSIIVSGAPASPETREAAINYFGNVLYIQLASTEFGQTTVLMPEDCLKKPTSCGKRTYFQEIKVLDDEGNEVPRGEIGEICCAGPFVFQGYYNDTEATKKAFHGRFGGVGDLGYEDEEGYFYVVDRKSDMIVSGSQNIYPAEIEAVLTKHPKIAELAVIGVPSEKWGEEVKAVIRLKPGEEANGEEIIDWCRGKMAGYKIPKSVDFVSSLPISGTGKVLKKTLREPYWAGYERRVR